MHLSSNGNKTIKDRMPAPACRSFFWCQGHTDDRRNPKAAGNQRKPRVLPDRQTSREKWNHHIPEIKWTPSANPLQPILAVYLFAGGGGTLLTLTFHGSALRLRRKRFASPYLHPVPIFLSILGNNLFVCDMFFLVLISLSFFIFFYYFLFATVTLVKKIKDAAQEFL